LKWGQGAKDIGGEVKLPSIERARQLKSRGYYVHPDPDDPVVEKNFHIREMDEFERHSRLGMVDEESFHRTVEKLRRTGAKYVTLKTGAYRPADLARAVKFSSDARIDLLTVDGAGGGTGMSPWRMMNEWGIPTVYLECLLYDYLSRLEKKGAFVPSCAIAGGIALEDHVFKAIALGAPFIKAVCLGRSTLTAATVAQANADKLRKEHDDEEHYQRAMMQTFVNVAQLKAKYGDAFARIPPAAIGMYNYYERLNTGLKQLMAGARKFRLDLMSRNDLTALTREAAEVSGIPYVMDGDKEEVDRILG
jgi:glutamate synthase domain-containing protein 2